MRLLILSLAVLSVLAVWEALTGCTPAKSAGSVSAVKFLANDGTPCYAILNGAGEPVGGSCGGGAGM